MRYTNANNAPLLRNLREFREYHDTILNSSYELSGDYGPNVNNLFTLERKQVKDLFAVCFQRPEEVLNKYNPLTWL